MVISSTATACATARCPPIRCQQIPDTFSLPANFKPERLKFPQIGIGTMAWGYPRRGWGITFNSTDLAEAYEICTDAGATLFDTSEVYGYQSVKLSEGSEQLLSRLVEKSPEPPLISTKFMPVLWTNVLAGGGLRIGKRAVVEACRASIARLGVGSVDVYSLHAPLPYVGGRRALFEGLAEARDLGLCRAIGLCDFNGQQLREAHKACKALGVPIVSNQLRYSIANIERELDGTIETCLELGVTPIAHTPLANGLATGFYAHALARRGGRRGRVGRFDASQLLTLSHLFEVMSSVAEEGGPSPSSGASGGGGGGLLGGPGSSGSTPPPAELRTEAQVALRFCIAKGCVPIPGVNNAQQALEVARALEWELDLGQVEQLSEQARLLHARRSELPWLKNL